MRTIRRIIQFFRTGLSSLGDLPVYAMGRTQNERHPQRNPAYPKLLDVEPDEDATDNRSADSIADALLKNVFTAQNGEARAAETHEADRRRLTAFDIAGMHLDKRVYASQAHAIFAEEFVRVVAG